MEVNREPRSVRLEGSNGTRFLFWCVLLTSNCQAFSEYDHSMKQLALALYHGIIEKVGDI
jgi:hypothetical protein